MSKSYPTDVLNRLRDSIVAWNLSDPALRLGARSIADFEATLERGEAIKQEIDGLEAHLIDLRNQRDEIYSQGWSYVTRLRAGIKGIYGDDASEYEMVGGTRRSERKPRSRRVKGNES